jgi:hypothetical protein
VCRHPLAKRQRSEAAARLTAQTIQSGMSDVPHQRLPSSWGPENARLAQLQGLAACRCGNRIRTPNPEVGGSPLFVGTGPVATPRYLRGVREGASFSFEAGVSN